MQIGSRNIGAGAPVYVVAELSANHQGDLHRAAETIRAASEAGADAIKLQTYTADTLTIDCGNEYFRIGKGTPWSDQTLYKLYQEAATPWEWHAELKQVAGSVGLDFFSTPFDRTAVDFLEELGAPAYKVASFEIVDIPLRQRIAGTRRPVILSTGMATLAEIDEAVRTLRESGCTELALLKCTSAYPAEPSDMHLRTIPHLAQAFGVPVGLSDHTLTTAVPAAAVAVGACIVEKHFILARDLGGPDSSFSLEPSEFREMVNAIRTVEAAMGRVHYGADVAEEAGRCFRRSLFVVEDVRKGAAVTDVNVRSIRPGHGLHTRHFETVKGRTFKQDVARGTPLEWGMLM